MEVLTLACWAGTWDVGKQPQNSRLHTVGSVVSPETSFCRFLRNYKYGLMNFENKTYKKEGFGLAR